MLDLVFLGLHGVLRVGELLRDVVNLLVLFPETLFEFAVSRRVHRPFTLESVHNLLCLPAQRLCVLHACLKHIVLIGLNFHKSVQLGLCRVVFLFERDAGFQLRCLLIQFAQGVHCVLALLAHSVEFLGDEGQTALQLLVFLVLGHEASVLRMHRVGWASGFV